MPERSQPDSLISRGLAQTEGMTEVVASFFPVTVQNIPSPSWDFDLRKY